MNLISIKNVTKEYKAGKTTFPALRGISFTIKCGEVACLAGSSGSGKTTLLNIIGCIDKPTAGTYTFKSLQTSQLSETQLTQIRKHSIGYIFQSFNLIAVLSAFENIEYPLLLEGKLNKKERIEKVTELLNSVELWDHRNKRPNELSGGQCQRVAVARALVKNPELVLADEPTANLDSVTGIKIIELMMNLNKKFQTTFLFSSHDDMVIQLAQRRLIIRDGLMIKEGTTHE